MQKMTKFGMFSLLPFTSSKGEMIPLEFGSTNSYFEEQYCKSNLKLPVWSVWSEKEVHNMSGRTKVLDLAVYKMLIYIVFPPKKYENPQREDWHMLEREVWKHFYPPFQNLRPHISVAWGLGYITSTLKQTADELSKLKGNVGSTKKGTFSYMFSEIECKIGQQTYSIYKGSIR